MRVFAATLPILLLHIAFTAHADAPGIPTLYVIGDSTAASYESDRSPLTGWAQVLGERFDPNQLKVDNRARSGRSSKSFLDEGAWSEIESALKPGDYVMIQFGHNDSKKEDPNRFTDPQTTYKQHLRRYVETTRAKGATPILLTSINRCKWESETATVDTMGGYPEAVRELAAELKVPLIDLHRATKELYESLGQVKTRELFMYLDKGASPNYPEGRDDGTHLQEKGARAISALAVDAIQKQNLPMANALLPPPTP